MKNPCILFLSRLARLHGLYMAGSKIWSSGVSEKMVVRWFTTTDENTTFYLQIVAHRCCAATLRPLRLAHSPGLCSWVPGGERAKPKDAYYLPSTKYRHTSFKPTQRRTATNLHPTKYKHHNFQQLRFASHHATTTTKCRYHSFQQHSLDKHHVTTTTKYEHPIVATKKCSGITSGPGFPTNIASENRKKTCHQLIRASLKWLGRTTEDWDTMKTKSAQQTPLLHESDLHHLEIVSHFFFACSINWMQANCFQIKQHSGAT